MSSPLTPIVDRDTRNLTHGSDVGDGPYDVGGDKELCTLAPLGSHRHDTTSLFGESTTRIQMLDTMADNKPVAQRIGDVAMLKMPSLLKPSRCAYVHPYPHAEYISEGGTATASPSELPAFQVAGIALAHTLASFCQGTDSLSCACAKAPWGT